MSLRFLHVAPFPPIKALLISPGQKPPLPWSLPDHSSLFLSFGLFCYTILLLQYLPILCVCVITYNNYLAPFFHLSYIFEQHSLSTYDMWAASWAWGAGRSTNINDTAFALEILMARWGGPTMFESESPAASKMAHAYQIEMLIKSKRVPHLAKEEIRAWAG